MIVFTVPGDPQGKQRARHAKGRTYTPAKTVAYEGLIALAAQQAMAGRELMAGPVHVGIVAYLSIPKSGSKANRAAMEADVIRPTKKPDLDNVAKATFDACNGVVFRDDAQIVDARQAKFYGTTPRLVVTIQEIEQ